MLYVGRQTREKGADLLADAFLEANRRDPRLRLVLAGGGPEQQHLWERLGDTRGVPRLARRRGPRARVRERRHVPVRQPHGHLRPGDPRGPGLGRAGGRGGRGRPVEPDRWTVSRACSARPRRARSPRRWSSLSASPEIRRRIAHGSARGGGGAQLGPLAGPARRRLPAGAGGAGGSAGCGAGGGVAPALTAAITGGPKPISRTCMDLSPNSGLKSMNPPLGRPSLLPWTPASSCGRHSLGAGAASRRARARLTSTARAPAPPARAKAAAGPAPSTTAPAAAAPSEAPPATAVESQANASVAVAGRRAPSTIAKTVALVGCDRRAGAGAGRRPSRAGCRRRRPAPRDPAASAHEHQREAGGRAAAAAEADGQQAADQRADAPEGRAAVPRPRCCRARLTAAVIATSEAPKTTPTATSTITSVRIAGARSAPLRDRLSHGGRPPAARRGLRRERRPCADQQRAARDSAAPVDHSAPSAERQRRAGDPGELEGASRRARSAAPRGLRVAQRAAAGSPGRRQAPTGGVARPIPAARATSSGSGAPAGSSGDRAEQREGGDGAAQQHGGLAAAVDERAEQRAADAERDRVGAGDDPGGGERAASGAGRGPAARC